MKKIYKVIQSRNQKETLVNHMKKIGGITKLEALKYYGIMNSGARINELRETYPEITTVMFQTPTGKRVAKYFFGDKKCRKQ